MSEVKKKFTRPEFEPQWTTTCPNPLSPPLPSAPPLSKYLDESNVLSRFGQRPSFEPVLSSTLFSEKQLQFASKCTACKKTIYHNDCDVCCRGICFQCDLAFTVEIQEKLKGTPKLPNCIHCFGADKYDDLCENHKDTIFKIRNKLFRIQPEALYGKYNTYQPTLNQVYQKNFVVPGKKLCIGCFDCACEGIIELQVYESHGVKDLCISDWDNTGKRKCHQCFEEEQLIPQADDCVVLIDDTCFSDPCSKEAWKRFFNDDCKPRIEDID